MSGIRADSPHHNNCPQLVQAGTTALKHFQLYTPLDPYPDITLSLSYE